MHNILKEYEKDNNAISADAKSRAAELRSYFSNGITENGYGHKPGQYDKSVRYDVPFFRCPSKGEFCKMLY